MPTLDHLTNLQVELAACANLRQHALGNSEVDSTAKGLIYESVLLRAFRAYENFLEQIFLGYLAGERKGDGTEITSFAAPNDLDHARKIVSSSANSRFLDWSSADAVRGRCQVFFEADDPIYVAIGGKSVELTWMKKVRNHVAHNSLESKLQFETVLRVVLLTLPYPLQTPGEFLQTTPKRGPLKQREVLAFFLELVEEVARAAVGIQTSDE